jgi:hypothetical protein
MMMFKHTRLLVPAACVVAVALFGALRGEAGPSGMPKATFVKGDVTFGPEAGPFDKVKRNGEIPAGVVVKTGEDSRAELKYPDGSIVRIGPASILKIDGVSFDGKTKEVKAESTLVAGQAWAKVAKIVGGEAKFQVKTQNAVAGVRGTVFRVNIEKDDATLVKVYTGAVAVSNSPFFANKGKETGPASPIDPNRKEIAKPFSEVTKKEWEQIVGKQMQVRVGGDGSMTQAEAFTPAQDKTGAEDEWVRWNEARDSGKDVEKGAF